MISKKVGPSSSIKARRRRSNSLGDSVPGDRLASCVIEQNCSIPFVSFPGLSCIHLVDSLSFIGTSRFHGYKFTLFRRTTKHTPEVPQTWFRTTLFHGSHQWLHSFTFESRLQFLKDNLPMLLVTTRIPAVLVKVAATRKVVSSIQTISKLIRCSWESINPDIHFTISWVLTEGSISDTLKVNSGDMPLPMGSDSGLSKSIV